MKSFRQFCEDAAVAAPAAAASSSPASTVTTANVAKYEIPLKLVRRGKPNIPEKPKVK